MLVLVFAASEDDAKECCCDAPTIKYLLKTLMDAFMSNDKNSKGYSDIELLQGKCGCALLRYRYL